MNRSKKLLSFALLTTTFICSACSSNQLAAPDDRKSFTCQLPSEYAPLSHSDRTIKTKVGPELLESYESKSTSGDTDIGVIVSPIPVKITSPAAEKKCLEGGKNEELKDGKTTLVKENYLTWHGLPALELHLSKEVGTQSVTIRQFLVISNQKLFQVICSTVDPAVADSPSINTFFESFKINTPSSSSN